MVGQSLWKWSEEAGNYFAGQVDHLSGSLADLDDELSASDDDHAEEDAEDDNDWPDELED